ncbi:MULTISPECIES: hypothetical protein [Clostridium]|uniref:Uncharacterized protein n=4 Tax=Clostridium TaxID=1485 RepID=D8GIF8_CLOLD|nr:MULTISPECIES: hypothetical protein [Clostridium]ADK17032.1 hypothetical protein CLJU_c40080 [Clostridium ljungdahlii DSM 13528]AGY76076.1 hypothetical protein CAETHG_1857 [Clostridium autoethanogenum DSM 10061]ALU36238.1 Hypothetical protein CLAU_1809 [Clostridium autoethanogenum DSM 10061]OAA85199.1 hypothetical protein WX45_00703 [Clostridium ljungdahlii DSM 13528]OVY48799.1 hypothetical protein WX72_00188 [Clostridium autoethanogenum]
MNVSSISNSTENRLYTNENLWDKNGNITKAKFDTSKALKIENANVNETNRTPSEILYIPSEDIDYEKCTGKDGKEFTVTSYCKIKGETLNKDYLDVFASKAQGKDVSYYDYYVNNFVAKIAQNFSDSSSLKEDEKSIKKGITDLIGEMKRNISKGISNNIENLNTKFKVNGVDFTLKELVDSSKVMDYACSIVNTLGGMDYSDYAEMGIAKGKVSSYAEKNLNVEQQKLLNSTMSARIQKVIDSEPEISTVIEDLKRVNIKIDMVTDKNSKYYAVKSLERATNKEYAQKIMDTFANVDYSNAKSFDKAIEEYKVLIKPVLEEAGIKNMGKNDALDYTIDYEANNLKTLFDKDYKRVISSSVKLKTLYGHSLDVYR